jgi:hypothetical protein
MTKQDCSTFAIASLNIKKKTKLSAWLVSNCKTHSEREEYAKELQKYINIDVYGACGINNSVCKDLPYEKKTSGYDLTVTGR